MLTSPGLSGARTNFLDTIDRAPVVPDTQAHHVTHSVPVIFHNEGMNESVTAPLSKVTSTYALGGLKTPWLSTPKAKQQGIRSNLQRIPEAPNTQYESSNTVNLQEEVLCHIDPQVTSARGRLGVWSVGVLRIHAQP